LFASAFHRPRAFAQCLSPRQALAILAELRPLTGEGRYLFSCDDDVPMSDNTINKALRIMGYDTGPDGDHCAHGFRSTASTLLNEEGAFDGAVMEAQLAHETEKKRGGAVMK
jgi:integrase